MKTPHLDGSRWQTVAKGSAPGENIVGMATITRAEQKHLGELFWMGDGYAHAVFSGNRDMKEFFEDVFGVDIYDAKYDLPERSRSKANRLRGFWAAESEYQVGRSILALMQRRVEARGDRPEDEQQLVARCEAIAKRLMAGGGVEMTPAEILDTLSHGYIGEQIDKCKAKMGTGDHSGAITNARTMIETVLLALEKELFDDPEDYKGEVMRLYKRVASRLNLDAGQPELVTPLRQVLTGLSSIVAGLAAVRNSASDAHGRFKKTEEHHARVAVNAAMTLTDFLLSTYEYQKVRKAASVTP